MAKHSNNEGVSGVGLTELLNELLQRKSKSSEKREPRCIRSYYVETGVIDVWSPIDLKEEARIAAFLITILCRRGELEVNELDSREVDVARMLSEMGIVESNYFKSGFARFMLALMDGDVAREAFTGRWKIRLAERYKDKVCSRRYLLVLGARPYELCKPDEVEELPLL
jgi:hypothetical protein